MSKYFIMALMAFTIFSCSDDRDVTGVEIDDIDVATSPLQNMVEDELTAGKGSALFKDAGDSASDPIVVPASQFVEHVLYTVDVCTFNFTQGGISGSVESLRTRFGGIFFGARSPVARTRWIPAPNNDCLINNNQAQTTRIYQLGTFYRIFGQTVRLSGITFDDFWVRTDPVTGQSQRVNFFEDGSVEFGEFVADPPGSVEVTPDICEGVDPWRPGVRYRRGALVTFRGFLFRRVRNGWRRIGACG